MNIDLYLTVINTPETGNQCRGIATFETRNYMEPRVKVDDDRLHR